MLDTSRSSKISQYVYAKIPNYSLPNLKSEAPLDFRSHGFWVRNIQPVPINIIIVRRKTLTIPLQA